MARPPMLRASFGLRSDELVVDSFAGGGGASTGIEAAIGRPVDLAINHNPVAIAMHAANHPETRHFCESVWEVDPKEACGGRRPGLCWFSPDCRHFSRAKGGAPVSKAVRGLAWVVIRWARAVKPRVIVLENVPEFRTWGPVDEETGEPIAGREGETFREWSGQLTELGYVLSFRELVAADYGTPTTRKRLFMVARCDGKPIVWPEPTHGEGLERPWRPASEVIDFDLPCPSIFEREKPLADATLRRIAAGLKRYVLDSADPFIVPVTHQGDARVHSIREPLRTVTGAHRGEFALVSPTLIQTGYGERPGQAPRVPGLLKPLGTVVAGGSKHALIAAFLTRHFGGPHGGSVGRELSRPTATVTAKDHHSLTAAFLTKFYGTARAGSSLEAPLPTVTSGGGKGGGHLAQVRAFLVSYYGSGTGQRIDDPLRTVTTHDRFGLVMVHGEPYQIADIGMRMLQPGELFRAQGFPLDYELDLELDGQPLTKTELVGLAGNAVCPQVAEAVVGANVVGERYRRAA